MTTGFSSVVDLSALDGTNGFAIDGIEADDNIASAVSEAGDFNNDGFADLIIGSPFSDLLGGAYLIFGSDAGFGSTFNLADLRGENGLFLEGTSAFFFTFGINGFLFPNPTQSFSGISVDGIGDFNADGFDDVAVGAPGGGAVESFIIYGSNEAFPELLDLDEDLQGTRGFEVEEPDDSGFELFGNSVSGIGDINGDGIADVMVGAPGLEDEPGEAYVVFGSTAAFPEEFDAGLLNGTNGFRLTGTVDGQEVGQSVSDASDVNGDGIDDLILGAPSSDTFAVSPRTYVVFGSRNGFPATIPLATLSGNNGFEIVGTDNADELGYFVSSAGDINADGLADLLIGAPKADANGVDSGQVHVVFGSQIGFPAQLNVATLNGNNGFTVDGLAAGDELGDVVSRAGDINDDGIADILLGAPKASVNGEASGQAYAIFGSQAGFAGQFDLNALDGSNGFIVNGIRAGDELGDGVSGIGDFNGDGVDDILLGAPDADAEGRVESGRAFVIYGRPSAPMIAGDDTNNVLTGTDEAETFEAGAGDDRIDAGAGDDTIAPGAGNDTIDGGAGIDTVRFAGDRSTFPIQIEGESLRVGSNSDTLTNIETLVFEDTTLDVAALRSQLVRVDVEATIAIALPDPVASENLNLYRGPSEDAVPDAELTDSSGTLVPGSIAVDKTGEAIDFIPTDGPLPADTYTLRLASRADGFANNGTLLDGDGNGDAGGNFQQTFAVAAPAEYVVSLPNVTFGPGETVQTFDRVTETQETGLPLLLNEGEGINQVEFAIAYDPDLLQVTGVAAGSLPIGWSVQSETVDAVLGTVTATLAGPTLAAGDIELARLSATVPEAAPYGDTGTISFSSLTLNDGAIAATGNAAIQVASNLGDANGDGDYTPEDAVAIAQRAVELGTGFASQPLVDPLAIGDVTGDGTVSALDAAIVANRAAGLQPPQLSA